MEADPHPVGGRSDGSENGRNEDGNDDRNLTHRLPPWEIRSVVNGIARL